MRKESWGQQQQRVREIQIFVSKRPLGIELPQGSLTLLVLFLKRDFSPRVLLCNSGCPGIYYVYQAGFELIESSA